MDSSKVMGDEKIPPTYPADQPVADVEVGDKNTYIVDRRMSVEDEITKAHQIQQRVPPLRWLRKLEVFLDGLLGGIETRGIDRIPEEDKQPPSILNAFFFWWSLNVHIGVVPLGLLGAEFGLDLRQSISAAVVGTMVGALCTAFTGTLGPKLGLRQIACSRYSFGFWGAKLCSILNVIIGGGFAVVNLVVVGQLLSAVSEYRMTLSVGIIIISIVGYLISLFGFRIVHTWEKYSWILTFILFLVLIGKAAPHVMPSTPGTDPGLLGVGNWLSIWAINFSNASGWSSIASDYYCNYPAKTSRLLLFVLTWVGIVVPTCFSVIIGACLGNAAINYTANYTPWATSYEDHGLGGLVYDVLGHGAFARFCLIVFTLSVLGNNIANTYSSGLSLQLLGHYFHAVPRLVWSLIYTIVVMVLGIAGKEHLSTILSNFVSLLGYWTVSYTVILLLEDKWFRRTEGYNLQAWNMPSMLPPGIAAVFSLLAGYLGGGVPGMSQVWYIGPIARKFGGYGGDVGIYMSFAITLLVYPIARTIEKKYVGR